MFPVPDKVGNIGPGEHRDDSLHQEGDISATQYMDILMSELLFLCILLIIFSTFI